VGAAEPFLPDRARNDVEESLGVIENLKLLEPPTISILVQSFEIFNKTTFSQGYE